MKVAYISRTRLLHSATLKYFSCPLRGFISTNSLEIIPLATIWQQHLRQFCICKHYKECNIFKFVTQKSEFVVHSCVYCSCCHGWIVLKMKFTDFRAHVLLSYCRAFPSVQQAGWCFGQQRNSTWQRPPAFSLIWASDMSYSENSEKCGSRVLSWDRNNNKALPI